MWSREHEREREIVVTWKEKREGGIKMGERR
jgi:hypothetical protein